MFMSQEKNEKNSKPTDNVFLWPQILDHQVALKRLDFKVKFS